SSGQHATRRALLRRSSPHADRLRLPAQGRLEQDHRRPCVNRSRTQAYTPAYRRRFLMKRRHRVASRALAALLTVLAALVGARVAGAEGGGQNQFPCTSTALREGALLPDLVPDQQLLTDDHVVWHDPQTGKFLLAFSAGIANVHAAALNVVGFLRSGRGSVPRRRDTMPASQPIFPADGPF